MIRWILSLACMMSKGRWFCWLLVELLAVYGGVADFNDMQGVSLLQGVCKRSVGGLASEYM